MFGDVYLCGGQSNMQFSVGGNENATAYRQEANEYVEESCVSIILYPVYTRYTPFIHLHYHMYTYVCTPVIHVYMHHTYT